MEAILKLRLGYRESVDSMTCSELNVFGADWEERFCQRSVKGVASCNAIKGMRHSLWIDDWNIVLCSRSAGVVLTELVPIRVFLTFCHSSKTWTVITLRGELGGSGLCISPSYGLR